MIIHFTKVPTLTGTVLPIEHCVRGFHDQGAETLEADVLEADIGGQGAKAGQRAGLLNANTHLKLSLCESGNEAAPASANIVVKHHPDEPILARPGSCAQTTLSHKVD